MYIHTNKKYQFGIILLALLFNTSSCTKKFDSINEPPFGSPTANVQQLYDGFVSNLQLQDEQVTHNSWTYAITQQGIVYTKPDYAYGNDGSELWSKFYHNLSNYNALMDVIKSNADTSVYTNVIAMVKVLRAYQAIRLSNFYGDIPFSKAGLAIYSDPNSYTPVYDKQQEVYLACLADLKWAIDNFKVSDTKQYSLGAAEFVLQNDINKWIEFANSFRLRVALTMYDKDNADATVAITDALSKPLLDVDGTNVGLYPANIPNMDLGARKYSFGTECRLRMGSTMWQLMSSNNNTDGSGIFDPRCTIYFEPNNAGEWTPFPQNPTTATPAEGGDPYNYSRDMNWPDKNGSNGTVNKYADFNYYWGRDETIPELFMTSAEVNFLKAEIYNRGIGGVTANPSTAQTEYENGIKASVNFWTSMAINSPIWVMNKPSALPSETVLSTMLAQPVVAYDATSSSNALKQIYTQEWIDMFRQSWEAWTLLKRTGGLTPMDSTNSAYYTQTYGSFNRYQYPTSEQTYNYANWNAETGGQDNSATKIWIEK
jgi:hypothetical protein